MQIAERLGAAFAEAGIIIGGHPIGATLSIGAATAYEPVADLGALIARADAALYRASMRAATASTLPRIPRRVARPPV